MIHTHNFCGGTSNKDAKQVNLGENQLIKLPTSYKNLLFMGQWGLINISKVNTHCSHKFKSCEQLVIAEKETYAFLSADN